MQFKLIQKRRIHYKVVGDSLNNKDWNIQLVDLIADFLKKKKMDLI